MGFSTVIRNTACFLFAAFLLLSCAGQRPPDGGPVDTEPPVVVSTSPSNFTTHFTGNRIFIEFNKYVDHGSVESSVFVSPSLGHLEFDWSGREVEIRFLEKLRRSTTYVVTIGTDAADLHNHNKMAQSYTLAFSTGDDIDHGAIKGRVYTKKDSDSPLGVMIFAYRLHDQNADTLNPTVTKPDYVTQTGRNGEFFLQHLSFGPYRVFAVRDEYKNLLYDPEVDDFAAAASDISVNPADTMRSDVWLKLAREDTTAIRLVKISTTNQSHLLAAFSSAVDTAHLSTSWFHIADTTTQSALNVRSVFPVPPQLTSAIIVTDTQATNAVYRLSVNTLRGANGIQLNPTANRLTFNASEAKDTLPLAIRSVSVPDTSKDVELDPDLTIQFSDAVQRTSVEQAVTLVDSSRNTVRFSFRWLSDASVQLVPASKLASKTWYLWRVGMRAIADLNGKRGRDSLRVFRFQTIDEELFSSIEGVVADGDSSDRKGDIFVLARDVSKREPKEYHLQLKNDGAFAIRNIVEGRYALFAYRDRNGNKKYDSGLVYPYQPAERFVAYPDTLKVRARWPLEGVQLKLR